MAKREGAGAKTSAGNFFEDFHVGQELRHATPRTVTTGDAALYTALYGSRFVLTSSDDFARTLGLDAAPIDDWLVFHVVFGKTVPDISLNAVANLGYAAGRFGLPVFPGDTLEARSTVIGLKENSSRKTGVVYVHTTGANQRGETVLDYVRWVMVNKRDPAAPAPETVTPKLPSAVAADDLIVPPDLDLRGYDTALAGGDALFEDYVAGERIDHVDGMTIEEAEHALATRLYQNTARVHFNQHTESMGRFGRRLIYGGHIISLARALSFNGLANAFHVAALNAGSHVAPVFAGDTIYAWTEVLETHALPRHEDLGALRVRTVAAKNQSCADFPYRDQAGAYHPAVVLDLDYTVLIKRR